MTRSVDLEPIDRLEDKVKMLVAMIERLRADHARSAEANAMLTREIETLRGRLAEADSVNDELSALRSERELVKARVGEMLQQIDALNL